MADTTSSSVKITIDVVDANSGEVVSRVTKNLQGLGEAGRRVGPGIADGAKQGVASLNTLGTAGASAGQKIRQGMDEAGAHTLTNLDKVRLLRDDLGIRIPRAMEAFISRSETAMNVIGGLGTAMVGLGAVEIFTRLAMGAYQLWQRLSDVNSEMQKYALHAAEAAQTKLFDTGSVETMRSLLQQTNAQIDALNSKRRTAGVSEDGTGSVAQYLGYGYLSDFHAYTKSDDKQAAAAREQRDAAQERLRSLDQQEQIEARTADGSARASALVGAAARNAKRQSDEAIASLKLQQTQLNEQELHRRSVDAYNQAKRSGVKDDELPRVYQADPHAGEADYNEQMRRIREQSGAENTAETRKQREETAHIQAEAHTSSLRGEAKYLAEYQEQQRQLRQAHADTLVNDASFYARRRALDEQYQADRQKRLDNENAETARIQAEAGAAGRTGLERLDAEHQARMDAIAKQAPDFSNPETRGKREGAEGARYQQEQDKSTGDFGDRIRQMDEGRADSTMSVNRRIEAETQRHRNEILKQYQELYGGLAAMDPRRLDGERQLNAELAAIDAEGARQKAQNRQQLEDQTYKAEAEAGRRGLTREQEARQAILDEYAERYRSLEELRARDADNADLYRRQEIAAEEIKNGKLLEQERTMRDKLAGELRGLMDNPLGELRKIGEDQASKFTADFILKHTGQASGDAGASGSKLSSLGDMLGLGGQGTGGWMHHGMGQRGAAPHGVAGTPAEPATAPPVVTASSNVSTASTTLRASSATIYVSQATFAGMSSGTGDAGTSAPAAAAGVRSGGAATGSAGTLSSASVANLGFPNLAPGAASSTVDLGGSLPAGDSGTSTTARAMMSAGSSVGNSGASMTGRIGDGISDAGSALQLGSSIASSFGKSSEGDSAAGNPGSGWTLDGSDGAGDAGTPAANAPNTAQSTSNALGKIGGAVGAGAGLFAAATGNGGAGGALKGAESGAQLGGMIGGPIGMAIGAAAGALVGFIGPGGAAHAEQYYQKTVRPRIAEDIMGFGMGAMDYSSAYNDLISLDKEARDATKQFGMGGKGVWNGKIHPDIINAQHQLTREQKAGRSQYGMNAGQYHSGGLVTGFGDFATSPTEGFSHLKVGETVMHEGATQMHGDALSMMLGGANREDMARFYGAGAGTTTAPPQSAAENHLHIHAIDTQAGLDFLMNNKHNVRAAMNQSYAENSGGSDLG